MDNRIGASLGTPAGDEAVIVTPQEREYLRRGYPRVMRPDLERLFVALDEAQVRADMLREDLMRCGSLAVSDRLDGSLGKRRADRIREIVWAACWPEAKR